MQKFNYDDSLIIEQNISIKTCYLDLLYSEHAQIELTNTVKFEWPENETHLFKWYKEMPVQWLHFTFLFILVFLIFRTLFNKNFQIMKCVSSMREVPRKCTIWVQQNTLEKWYQSDIDKYEMGSKRENFKYLFKAQLLEPRHASFRLACIQ